VTSPGSRNTAAPEAGCCTPVPAAPAEMGRGSTRGRPAESIPDAKCGDQHHIARP